MSVCAQDRPTVEKLFTKWKALPLEKQQTSAEQWKSDPWPPYFVSNAVLNIFDEIDIRIGGFLCSKKCADAAAAELNQRCSAALSPAPAHHNLQPPQGYGQPAQPAYVHHVVPPPPPPTLPGGWVSAVDERSGNTYYYHPTTGNTSWTPPHMAPPPPPLHAAHQPATSFHPGQVQELLPHFAQLQVSGPTPARGRIALLIGNDDYDERSGFHPLSTCRNDARGMAQTLQGMGFDVHTLLNANNQQFRDALYDFVERIQDNYVAVLFFSGHGQAFGNSNYLVPTGVTTPLKREDDFEFSCINLNFLLGTFNRRAPSTSTVCIFLDCCRSDPKNEAFKGVGSPHNGFLKSPSAAAPAATTGSPKPSMVIGYATAPGTVATTRGGGQYSPYTHALMQHLPTRRKDLRQLQAAITREVEDMTQGQQQPWCDQSLRQDEFIL